MAVNLNGSIALVTRASQDLGAALARALVAEGGAVAPGSRADGRPTPLLFPCPAQNVLVFENAGDPPEIPHRLRAGLTPFGRWNFNLDACDHLLRVEGEVACAPAIIRREKLS